MKFRRPLRRDVVMARIKALFTDGLVWSSDGTCIGFTPAAQARAGALLPQDERSGREARVEDPRQLSMPL